MFAEAIEAEIHAPVEGPQNILFPEGHSHNKYFESHNERKVRNLTTSRGKLFIHFLT